MAATVAMPTPRMAAALSRVVPDADLLQDISATCVEAGITSAGLATGKVDVAEVAQRLYLTENEANALIQECKRGSQPPAAPAVLISVDGEHADSMTLPQLLEQEQLLQAVASKGKALVDLPLPPVAEPNEIAVHLSVDRKAANPPCDSCPADPLDELLPAAEVEEGEVKPVAELPSYLRPTAAHQARASRASPLPTIAQEPQEALPAASPVVKKRNKYSNVLARVFAPTATFLARMTGKGPSSAKAPPPAKSEVLRQSMVQRILNSPQGQRTTPLKPFSPHLTAPKPGPEPGALTSEEAALMEAQKSMFKRNMVPKHVYEARPIAGVYSPSEPKSPQDIFQPFQLASELRHTADREKREAELSEQRKEEERKRAFRALKFDKSVIDSVESPAKVEPRAPTIPQGPQLSIEQRIEHHRKELAPAKWARMSVAEKKKLEERKREIEAEEAYRAAEVQREKEERERARALEKMSVDELRKSMVFRARPLPSFDDVFRPDKTKSSKVTQSMEFNFRTDDRLGKALSPAQRIDMAGAAMGLGRFDGQGYADAFSASLRSSAVGGGSVRMLPMRASIAGPLMSAAVGSPRGALRASMAAGGGGAPWGSTHAARGSPSAATRSVAIGSAPALTASSSPKGASPGTKGASPLASPGVKGASPSLSKSQVLTPSRLSASSGRPSKAAVGASP